MVVIFGRTGVGVSSLVNLIAGSKLAECHADLRPCTQKMTSHAIEVEGKQLRLYEIPGFGGSSTDSEIIDCIQNVQQDYGIDVLVHCLRKQRQTFIPEMGEKVRSVLPRGVRTIAVVTELEWYKGDMGSWWTSSEGTSANGAALEKLGLTFQEHVCITTLSPEDVARNGLFSKRRQESQKVVRELLIRQLNQAKRSPGSSHTG